MGAESFMRRATAPAAVALTILALVLVSIFGRGLPPAGNVPQIGQPAPHLAAPSLAGGDPVDSGDLAGRSWMLNFWASWCDPCRDEHPYLMMLAAQGITIVGISYRDDRQDSRDWLDAAGGSPYAAVGVDRKGLIGNAWQVSGVPVSFLIDEQGVVSRRFNGAIDSQAKVNSILAWLK